MTISPYPPRGDPCLADPTLHHPRILCLHWGVSNARIFQAQCGSLRSELSNHFRLVFANAPFPSEPGPDVTTVYQSFGPYRRWLRSGPHHPKVPAREVIERIDESILAAMKESDRQGATGKWVGVLGFSQGAKIAASLLLRQQALTTKYGKAFAPTTFKFGVTMAGRAPLVALESWLFDDPAIPNASEISMQPVQGSGTTCRDENLLRLPTIHVHGLKDPGLSMHRAVLEGFCAGEAAARVVEWDGAHRVPIKTKDVQPVIDAILDLGQATGALKYNR